MGLYPDFKNLRFSNPSPPPKKIRFLDVSIAYRFALSDNLVYGLKAG